MCASVDIWGQGDQELFLGSWKSCDEMSIDFGRNRNNGIPMKPSTTIRTITSHFTSMENGTVVG